MSLLRWQLGYGVYGIPQAATPIAFALLTIPLTGSAQSGAVMVFVMTAAQIAGAVPFSRLGRHWQLAGYIRVLVTGRTAALVALRTFGGGEACRVGFGG